jgi:ADP-dependent NAD(P)H-hydrate dehydratase / NAD(P)H-hydrate epimerase
MLTEVKKSDLKTLYPKRAAESHKGDNGRVLVVGGSLDYYGAPILSGMGALFGGTDLVTLMVPQCNFDVSRSYYPDFIVKAFPGNHLDARSVELISLASANQKCVVIGPGLGDHPDTLMSVQALIRKIKCPIILDAQAIAALPHDRVRDNHRILITPHTKEFGNIFHKLYPRLLSDRVEAVQKNSPRLNVNILLKGPVDVIASPDGGVCISQTGNPGLTSGGTGDVLAGTIASLVARGLSLYDSARLGAFIIGSVGEDLQLKKRENYTATDVALQLPYTIARLLA